MGLSINGGGSQLRAIQYYGKAQEKISESTERLATGKRINRASDDPARLIGAEDLRSDLVELSARLSNVNNDGQVSNLTDSVRSTEQGLLIQLRGRLVAASGDTASPEEKQAIQQEVDATIDAIELVSASTGVALSSTALRELRSSGEASVSSDDIEKAVQAVDDAIKSTGLQRVEAAANHRYGTDVDRALLESNIFQTTKSLSLIEDADYAVETAKLVQSQILFEAATSVLALEASNLSNQILGLLEPL